MLTQLVVSTYKGIAELALWVMIITGAAVGYAFGGSMGHGTAGLIIGAVGTFFFMAVFLGAALLLQDIHTRLARIEQTFIASATPRAASGVAASATTPDVVSSRVGPSGEAL